MRENITEKLRPIYVDTTDKDNITAIDALHNAEDFADEITRYLEFRGCSDVFVNLTKYNNVVMINWFPRRCSDADIYPELVNLCNEYGYHHSTNPSELIKFGGK